MWQKEAVKRLSARRRAPWLAPVVPADVDERAARAFIEAVLPNVVLPEDARGWADVVFGDLPPLAGDDEQVVRSAGAGYFSAAAERRCRERQRSAGDRRAPCKRATGKTGAALYKPLRLALTGRTHGPELAPLLKAMPPGKARERLARFAA